MKKLSIIILITAIIIAVGSCKKNNEENIPAVYTPSPLTINIPSNLPIMVIPSDNPTTVEGVELGRRLYYDSLLHPDHKMACASCHVQSAGFTTQGTNVIPHINLGFSNKFLWNGAVQGSLEDAMLFEVKDFFKTDISKLQNTSVYPEMFNKAFGSNVISEQRCAYALAQFLRTMVSGNSKFDKFKRNELVLNLEELKGWMIFFTEQGDCFHCHSLSLMTDGNLHNIGLDSVFAGSNAGYYNVSNNPADLGKFKTPSLRNCGIRTSFMHDGRFHTLDEVIEHYNSYVKISPSVDPIMTKPGKVNGLQLTDEDKKNLKAFLLTLTDSVYLNNAAFSSPF